MTTTSSYSLDEVYEIWTNMEKRFLELKAVTEPGASPATPSPKRIKVAHEMVAPVGRAREFMEGLLGTRNNDRLKDVFGDCELVANIRETVSSAREILQRSQLGWDDRMAACLAQCDSVEEILASIFRLQDKLAEAHRRAATRAAAPLSLQQRLQLLLAIDEGEESEADAAIDRLFATYDAQGEGFLTGQPYEEIIDLVSHYVAAESKERAERRKMPFLAHTPEQVRGHVLEWLDPDGDGRITREEARAGVRAAVDDIEKPAEVMERRRTLDTARAVVS